MLRRLGHSAYRADSPSLAEGRDAESLSLSTDMTLPSIDYTLDDSTSLLTLSMSDSRVEEKQSSERDAESQREQRVVDKREMAVIEANVCRKLDTIVNLVADFTADAMGLREQADELLDELRGKVLPYLVTLDTDMRFVEGLLRFNIDRCNISEQRIDWLLTYNQYQNEMRRVFSQLADDVYADLENSLELRSRGLIARRPCSLTLENLHEMRLGMQRAVSLLCPPPRSVA